MLDTVTYHQNDDWFYNIEDTGDDVEAEMRSATYIDPSIIIIFGQLTEWYWCWWMESI